MTPIAPAMTPPRPPTYITVMLDGKLVGHVRSLNAPALVSRLRNIKAAKLAEEEALPAGAHTIILDVSTPLFKLVQKAVYFCHLLLLCVQFCSLLHWRMCLHYNQTREDQPITAFSSAFCSVVSLGVTQFRG